MTCLSGKNVVDAADTPDTSFVTTLDIVGTLHVDGGLESPVLVEMRESDG